MDDSDIYEKHMPKVYGFFMAKTWHKQTAEDLTSDVFVAAFEQFRIREIEDKQKYLYGIMKLTWLRYLRQKYTSQVSYVEEIDDFSSYVDETLREVVSQSLIDRALPFIEKLPEAQKQVMLLRFRDGNDLKTIASTLQKNMNYVKTTQRRGLASLKQLVEGA